LFKPGNTSNQAGVVRSKRRTLLFSWSILELAIETETFLINLTSKAPWARRGPTSRLTEGLSDLPKRLVLVLDTSIIAVKYLITLIKNWRKHATDQELPPMEVGKERFRKMFPNLAREISDEEKKVTIDSIRTEAEAAEKSAATKKNLSNYDPDVIDFLRRCDNVQQAEEIITYMQNRGEVTPDYAKKLRQQLKKKGIRSFGSKKEEGYYFKASEQ
jgi:hypothetical protein